MQRLKCTCKMYYFASFFSFLFSFWFCLFISCRVWAYFQINKKQENRAEEKENNQQKKKVLIKKFIQLVSLPIHHAVILAEIERKKNGKYEPKKYGTNIFIAGYSLTLYVYMFIFSAPIAN